MRLVAVGHRSLAVPLDSGDPGGSSVGRPTHPPIRPTLLCTAIHHERPAETGFALAGVSPLPTPSGHRLALTIVECHEPLSGRERQIPLCDGDDKASSTDSPGPRLDASLSYYEQLGFKVRAYEGGGYGFAKRDRVEIHLGFAPDIRPSDAKHSAYLWVDDADELAQSWLSAGVEVHMPEDTEWGQHEGAVVDPDGNVLRFGSPIK